MKIKTINKLAEIFPKLNETDFKELCEDIKRNGLIDPITIYNDEVIDGRHRYLACLEVGIEPVFEEYKGNDPYNYVISKNLLRRHLNESQRAMVGAELSTLKRGDNQHTTADDYIPDEAINTIDLIDSVLCDMEVPIGTSTHYKEEEQKTIDEIAGLLNISERSIKRANVVKNNGSDELIEAVKQGEVSVSTASQIAELPKEEQVEIVAKGEKEILAKAKELKIAKQTERLQKREEEKQQKLVKYLNNQEHTTNDILEAFKQSYINGNSLDKLKELDDQSIDLVITDPPYGINYQNSRREVNRLKTEYGILNDDPEENKELINGVLAEIHRTLKDGRHLYWFGRADVIYSQIQLIKDNGFTVKNVLIWLKNNHGTGDAFYSYSSRYEVCVFAIKDTRLIKGCQEKNRQLLDIDGTLRHDDILEFSKVSSTNLIHDHQKPQDLLTFLLNKSSHIGEKVLDPFAGSGSTIIACLNNQRQAIGFELDPEIHEHSIKEWSVSYGK